MFTVEQIREAHSKVKSGADFPAYIRDLKALGVAYYETFVLDGHTDYHGTDGYKTSTPAGYAALEIAGTVQARQFQSDLAAHQQGKTDYPTFCHEAARSGVAGWVVCMEKMTCTYYGQVGDGILEEQIPR